MALKYLKRAKDESMVREYLNEEGNDNIRDKKQIDVASLAFNLSLCQTSFKEYSIDLWENIVQFEVPESQKLKMLVALIVRSSYSYSHQYSSKLDTTKENLRMIDFE